MNIILLAILLSTLTTAPSANQELANECGGCGQLFMLTVDDLKRLAQTAPPGYWSEAKLEQELIIASSGGLLFESSPQLKSCISDGGTSRDSCGWEEVCVVKMEAAMRVMDEFLKPPAASGSYDGCNHCTETGCTLMACSYGPERELARLEWEVEQIKKQVEWNKQKALAYQQWATVKRECWSQP